MRKLKFTAVVMATLALTSCEVISDLGECVCSSRTGNAKLDAFFASAESLQSASDRVQAKLDGSVSDLALTLGLTATATPAEVHTALCTAFADASTSFALTYSPPECTIQVDIAARAAAECDVSVDPGQVDIQCNARCDGTCRATCTGACRLPSMRAYCDGTCHGTCEVDVSTVCYGTCHGTCTGSCSVPLVAGECHGGCDATCNGRCETTVAGSCTGECRGECEIVVTGGECNARCDGTCQGRCEGRCDGDIQAPQIDADCQAQVEARARAEIECVPPRLTFTQDETGVTNISAITHHVGRVIAAGAEVDSLITALGDFATPLGDVTSAVINGELSATQAGCASTQIDNVTSALDSAKTALGTAATTEATILGTCI